MSVPIRNYEIEVRMVNADGELEWLFATAPGTITTEAEFVKVLDVFRKQFPKSKFRISAHYWLVRGQVRDKMGINIDAEWFTANALAERKKR